MGFIKAHSIVSLIMGLLFAAGLSFSSWKMFKGKKWGLYLAIVLVAALGVFFGIRFFNTCNFIPGGAICLVSALTLGIIFRK